MKVLPSAQAYMVSLPSCRGATKWVRKTKERVVALHYTAEGEHWEWEAGEARRAGQAGGAYDLRLTTYGREGGCRLRRRA
jgi:hypothetical protein